jgi:hypothetical protein
MVWEQQYNQEPGRASLNYVSLGIGFVIGLQVSGPLIDKVLNLLSSYNLTLTLQGLCNAQDSV